MDVDVIMVVIDGQEDKILEMLRDRMISILSFLSKLLEIYKKRDIID